MPFLKRPVSTAAVTLGVTLLAAPAFGQEPLADLVGLPDGPVLETVRAAVGTAEESAETLFDARRRADQARDRAVAALRSEGYYGARVEARVEPGDTPRARLEISPGQRFVFGVVRVELTGDETDEAARAANEAAALMAGAPARAADVIAAETRAVAAVEAVGFPDAEAMDREIVVDHGRGEMDVTLRVSAGRAAVFGPITTTGGARLRPAYIARLAPFEEGQRYDRAALEALGLRLNDTGAFETATVRLAPSEGPGEGPEERAVIADVRTGLRHSVALGAIYSTSDGSGVEGSWSKRNVFGGAETLTIAAALRTLDRRVGVELAAPHWRRPDRTLRLTATLSDEETDAYDRQAFESGARIERKLSKRLGRAVGAGVTVSRVEDADSIEEFALANVSGSISWDGSDDLLDPTRGFRASALARPTVGVGDDPVGYVVAEVTGSAYQPLNNRVVAAIRGRFGDILGPAIEEVPADERFFAGGGGSIRGYEYQAVSPRDAEGNIVGGRSVFDMSAELRYRGAGRLGYVAFLDGGAASDGMVPQADEMRWGAGFGIRYYTRFGPVRADVAFPLDRRDGEPGAQLYIALGQDF